MKVVLDANVLFPFSLRDTLLRAAAEGHFQVYWSPEILEEARRSLVKSAAITEPQASRLLERRPRVEDRHLERHLPRGSTQLRTGPPSL